MMESLIFSDECALPSLNSRVQYRTSRQLERYVDLLFQIQYKHMNSQLQQSMISLLTELMESPGLSTR